MIILYDNVIGETMRLAKRFNIKSKEITTYDANDDRYIVLLARKELKNEDLSFLKVFINKKLPWIKGVIIHDDKMFGDEYGQMISFFTEREVKVLRVWDKIVSDEEIRGLEVELNGITRNIF